MTSIFQEVEEVEIFRGKWWPSRKDVWEGVGLGEESWDYDREGTERVVRRKEVAMKGEAGIRPPAHLTLYE